MSFVAGYESSSSEEDEEVTATVQGNLLPPLVVSKVQQKSTPSSLLQFPPLPKSNRPSGKITLPLLIEEDNANVSSSESSDDEYFLPPNQAKDVTTEEAVYQPMPMMTGKSTLSFRFKDNDDAEDMPLLNVVAVVEKTSFPSSTTPSVTASSSHAVVVVDHIPEEKEILSQSKRVKPAEELIRDMLANKSLEGGEVVFDAELNTSEIRKEASLFQARKGGLLAANLSKGDTSISGKRNHQLSHLAQVAQKQKKEAQLLE